jgi:CarD family transcriptional regulator
MFKKGDPVLHPQHGAGIVTKTQTWEVSGVERRYYCIELVNASGMLMIPIEHAEVSGLRRANSNPDSIATIFARSPEILDSDYRTRHIDVAAKVHSGDPELVAQALRDLIWRKQVDKLSMRDEQLKEEAHALLVSVSNSCELVSRL